MQRQHICQSWLSNRVKLPTDYFLSARVFLPKALIAKNWVVRNLHHFFPLSFASFFLVNPRDTGRPKLLNELPKIANWYLSTSSIIGGRIRRIVCPSSILATWQVRQMGVLLYFLERFMCGEWMYVSSLKMDGKTCMLQLQLRQARMQTVLV